MKFGKNIINYCKNIRKIAKKKHDDYMLELQGRTKLEKIVEQEKNISWFLKKEILPKLPE
jgi:predicted transcriptional regulator